MEQKEKSLNLMKLITNRIKLSLHKLKTAVIILFYSEDRKDVQSLHTILPQYSSAYKEQVRLGIFSMFK